MFDYDCGTMLFGYQSGYFSKKKKILSSRTHQTTVLAEDKEVKSVHFFGVSGVLHGYGFAFFSVFSLVYLHRESLEVDRVLRSSLVLFAPVESNLVKLILVIAWQWTSSNHCHRKPGGL